LKKILLVLMSLFLLVGCSNNGVSSNESEDKSIDLFKKEIKDITLAEMKVKNVPDEISEESIDAIIDPMIEQSGILVKNKNYSDASTAMIKNGNEIFGGSKILVSISAEGEEKALQSFLSLLTNLDMKFTTVTIDVNKSVDKYKLDIQIVFYSKQSIAELNSTNSIGTISRIENYKEEDTKIVLRDSDFFGSVRNSTSDISAVRFTKNDNNDMRKAVEKDRNQIEDVNIELTKEGKKYYFRYYIDDEKYPKNKEKEEFKPKSKDILIDILSREKRGSEDIVGMNLIITNTTDKKVDVKVYEDDDKRVQIIYK